MLKDKVQCNWCEEISIVDREEDECPKCNRKGFLRDIEQDIEVWSV